MNEVGTHQMKHYDPWTDISFMALISIFMGCIVYHILIYSVHTLDQRDNWFSVKSFNPVAVMTPQEIMTERVSLSNQKLQLGSWNGFNELLWSPAKKIQNEIEFFFELEAESFLDMAWVNDDQEWEVLRLKSNSSKILQLENIKETQSGVITDKKVYIGSDQNIISQNNILKITQNYLILNGRKIELSVPINLKYFESIKFRNGSGSAVISSIRWDQNQEEYFSPYFHFSAFIFSLILTLIFYFFFVKTKSILFISILFTLFMTYSIFDKYFYLPTYNIEVPATSMQSNLINFEKYRQKFFYNLMNFVGFKNEHVDQRFSYRHKNNWIDFYSKFQISPYFKSSFKEKFKSTGLNKLEPYFLLQYQNSQQISFVKDFSEMIESSSPQKYLFVGASQVWGGGAISFERKYPFALSQWDFKKQLQTCILASPGLTSSELIDWNNLALNIFKPKVVFYALGLNDFDHNSFKNNIESMLTTALDSKSKPVIIIEATSSNFKPDYLEKNRFFLKEIAQQKNIAIFDLNHLLQSHYLATGEYIYRDSMHLTDRGHQLAAQGLYNFLKSRHLF